MPSGAAGMHSRSSVINEHVQRGSKGPLFPVCSVQLPDDQPWNSSSAAHVMEVPPDRALNIHGPVLHFTRRRRRCCIASFPLALRKPSSGLFVQGSVMQLTGSQFPGNGPQRRRGYAKAAKLLSANPDLVFRGVNDRCLPPTGTSLLGAGIEPRGSGPRSPSPRAEDREQRWRLVCSEQD